MTINELIEKYYASGVDFKSAKNLGAQEILLTNIAKSPLSENVTLKGGVVMYNLTKNKRRVTEDVDFDLIKYSIDENSIILFVNKLNQNSDDFTFSIKGKPKPLHHENYHGKRIELIIKDKENTEIRTKIDIGVHIFSAIEQQRIAFTFESQDESLFLKVNPPEQIFAEKLLSLIRFGSLSTRYKDIYDMYYLLNNKMIDLQRLRLIITLLLKNEKHVDSINSVSLLVADTLNNETFTLEASKPTNNWLIESYETVKKCIVKFLSEL